jgi:hypothetical protein
VTHPWSQATRQAAATLPLCCEHAREAHPKSQESPSEKTKSETNSRDKAGVTHRARPRAQGRGSISSQEDEQTAQGMTSWHYRAQEQQRDAGREGSERWRLGEEWGKCSESGDSHLIFGVVLFEQLL